MSRAWLLAWVLVSMLGPGCGAPPAPPQPRKALEEPLITLIVIDPLGRLANMSDMVGPLSVLRMRGGEALGELKPSMNWARRMHSAIGMRWGWRLQDEALLGTEIMVVHAGCTPARHRLHRGRNFVHLRKGVALTVRVTDVPTPPPGIGLSLRLESKVVRFGEVPLRATQRIVAVGATYFERDEPTHAQNRALQPGDQTLDLLVPAPAEYEVSWHMHAPAQSTSSGLHESQQVSVPSDASPTLVWPERILEPFVQGLAR